MLYTKGWLELAKITTPNIVNYCVKNGYSWNIQCIDEPYYAFEKLKQIQKIFSNNEADIVMSMDCDALITNYNIKIESFLDEENDLYICKDFNGINAGVFILKSSIWAEFFLKYTIPIDNITGVDCEQNAIENFIKDFPTNNKIKILPHPSINSYHYNLYPEIPLQSHEQGNWNPTDFILHLPGIGMDKRLEIIKTTPVIL